MICSRFSLVTCVIHSSGFFFFYCCCCYLVTKSCLTLFDPWIAAHQALLSFAFSQNLLKSRPLSRWCYLTISFSATPFSFCLQSFPTSGSLPVSWLFASGSQSIGTSTSASVLPMNIHGWFPLGLTVWFPAILGTLKSLVQKESINVNLLF